MSVSTDPKTSTGRLIAGRYLLRDSLGRGGMGIVWDAEDTVLGRDVAVKEVLFPPYISDEERSVLRERTMREARLAARLSHPGAVTVYDVVEEDGQPFLVLELVRARTLAEVVREDGPLAPAAAARMALDVLGALEAAHQVGIVHRDVKPGNVMVRDTGRATLTDFGIATSTNDATITGTGLLLGSPSYIAPERAKGHRPGPESDLWSLGATLYTAVEGRPPFDRGEALPTLTAVVSDDHEPCVAAGPLEAVIDGLLVKDPAQRWDARHAREALEVVARTGLPVAEPEPEPAAEARASRTQALPLDAVQSEPPEVPPTPAPATPAATRVAPAAPPVPRRRDADRPRRARTAAPPRRRRGVLLPLVVTSLLIVALVLGLQAVLGNGDGNDSTDRTPSANGTGSTSGDGDGGGGDGGDGGGGSDGGGDGGASDIDGWETYTSPAGWAIQHPPGWTQRSGRGGTTDLVDPEGGRYIRVDVREKADPAGAQAAWEKQEPFVRDRFGASYQRLSIEEVDYRDYDTADWEFRFSDEGADLHVRNRGFVVDGRGYALYFQTHENKWDASQDIWRNLVRSFRPAS